MAKQIEVIKGQGYFADKDGKKIMKAVLPAGVHEIPDDLVYVECDNRQELDAVHLDRPEPPKKQDYKSEVEACKTIDELKSFIRDRLL